MEEGREMPDQPWLALYPPGVPPLVPVRHQSLVDAWAQRTARDPDAPAVAYFDGILTARELDVASDAFAAAMQSMGTGRGDRAGTYLQNIPQYATILLALWKLAATGLVVNRMYRRQELRRLIDDSGATGVICSDGVVEELAGTLAGSTVQWLVSTSSLDYQTRNDPRIFASFERFATAPDGDLRHLREKVRGARPQPG